MNKLNKDQFLNLEISDQIDYLNKQLNKGSSVKDVRLSIGIGEKMLQRIIKKNGYKYDQKAKNYKKDTEVIKSLNKNYQSNLEVVNNTEYKSIEKVVDNKNYQSNTKVVNELDIQENTEILIPGNEYKQILNTCKNIKGMNEKLEELYKWYELQCNVIDIEKTELKIDPKDDEITVRSFKVYKNISDQFSEICKKYSNYKVQDIISQALMEFTEKYK